MVNGYRHDRCFAIWNQTPIDIASVNKIHFELPLYGRWRRPSPHSGCRVSWSIPPVRLHHPMRRWKPGPRAIVGESWYQSGRNFQKFWKQPGANPDKIEENFRKGQKFCFSIWPGPQMVYRFGSTYTLTFGFIIFSFTYCKYFLRDHRHHRLSAFFWYHLCQNGCHGSLSTTTSKESSQQRGPILELFLGFDSISYPTEGQ